MIHGKKKTGKFRKIWNEDLFQLDISVKIADSEIVIKVSCWRIGESSNKNLKNVLKWRLEIKSSKKKREII